MDPIDTTFSRQPGTTLALEVQHLCHVYTGSGRSFEVLHDLSFGLPTGEVLAILGPSGSGKSTLLHLLGGLETASAGEIFWGNHRLRSLGTDALARLRAQMIGFVFQHHYLVEDLTVLENVALPSLISNRPDTPHARQLLERVGLKQLLSAYPQTLSGGERQRVALARALQARPRLLFADEPTGSLDRANAKVVFELLVELAREEGTAVVVVTHDETLSENADRVLRLVDGRLSNMPGSDSTIGK